MRRRARITPNFDALQPPRTSPHAFPLRTVRALRARPRILLTRCARRLAPTRSCSAWSLSGAVAAARGRLEVRMNALPRCGGRRAPGRSARRSARSLSHCRRACTACLARLTAEGAGTLRDAASAWFSSRAPLLHRCCTGARAMYRRGRRQAARTRRFGDRWRSLSDLQRRAAAPRDLDARAGLGP